MPTILCKKKDERSTGIANYVFRTGFFYQKQQHSTISGDNEWPIDMAAQCIVWCNVRASYDIVVRCGVYDQHFLQLHQLQSIKVFLNVITSLPKLIVFFLFKCYLNRLTSNWIIFCKWSTNPIIDWFHPNCDCRTLW